jgi:hypothetical protein
MLPTTSFCNLAEASAMAPGTTRQPPGSGRHALTPAAPGGTRTTRKSVRPEPSPETATPADTARPAGAPAPLAERDELAAWLAANWGALADTPAELLDQIDL